MSVRLLRIKGRRNRWNSTRWELDELVALFLQFFLTLPNVSKHGIQIVVEFRRVLSAMAVDFFNYGIVISHGSYSMSTTAVISIVATACIIAF